MPYETDATRLQQDLADPLFTCYVYVGDESDEGWKVAKFCHGLLTRLNIYLFADHTHLGQILGDGSRPKGMAFGWGSKIKQTLNAAAAKDLGVVMKALVEAQKQ